MIGISPPSVVLLSFQSERTLPALLRSLDEQSVEPGEVLILDNASKDASERIGREWAAARPGARFHAFEENLGFARAMNHGIDHTAGDVVCLLNADVELDRRFLELAMRGFDREGRIGMVTGAVYRLVGGRRTRIVDSLGVAVTRGRVIHDIGSEKRLPLFAVGTSRPFGVSGCCPLYRRTMLEDVRVGGECFRERFESYFEDVDLAWRARLRGWSALCIAGARAWHVREGSLEGRHRIAARQRAFRNRYWTFFLNESLVDRLLDAPFWLPQELFQLAKLFLQPELWRAAAGAITALPSLVGERLRNRRASRVSRRCERAFFSRGDGSLLRRIGRRLREEVASR